MHSSAVNPRRVVRLCIQIAIAVLLLAVFAPFHARAAETPRPLTSDDMVIVTPPNNDTTVAPAAELPTLSMTPGWTPSPAAGLAPTPTPSAALTNDMRSILRKVGTIPCVEPTRSRMFALLYESNVVLHDTCVADSKYQFFPYTGKLPTTTQIIAVVKSQACMELFAGAILAQFPECDIDFVSVRSSAEVFYRIKADIDADRVPPTQAQFYEFYNLNRVVNLLNENETLIEDVFRDSPTAAAVSLSEMSRLMNPIQLLPGVTLGDDMSITTASETAPVVKKAAAPTGSSLVQGTTTTAELPKPATPPAMPLTNTTDRTSSAWAPSYRRGSKRSHVGVAVAVAVLMALAAGV